MGCTVRTKHVRPNRKTRSKKPQFDPSSCLLDKASLSSLKHLVYHPSLVDANPSGNFEENGLGYCTEEQLEDLLLKHLECFYNEAVSKLVVLGYDEDVALRAVLSNGYCYGGVDVLTNIMHNALAHLSNNKEGGIEDGLEETVFTDLRQLVEYSLAGMVYLLQQVKPRLSRGDALWCLLVSELHVGKASMMDIPMRGTDLRLQREVDDCPRRRFNLTPSMKSLLRENVAAFAAGFRASSMKQSETNEQTTCSSGSVSSVMEKFQDLNLDESVDTAPEKDKDVALLGLLRQVQELKRQVNDRREWAEKKAMQAAAKVSDELAELQSLRSEREETLRLKKWKQTHEESTVKRISDMENDLRKVSSHIDKTNMMARTLENENAVIRAEMEASKLSASESLEATKKEKKGLKKLVMWEKQKLKLEDEIEAEKEKIKTLNMALAEITHEEKEYEEKWREEKKAKEQVLAQVEEEQRFKEATEVRNKGKVESLRLKIEIDFQRHKDDLQRLEQELSRLNKISSSDSSLQSSDNCHTNGKSDKLKGEVMCTLLEELERLDGLYEKEETYDRECLICMRDEVSVVFLPCAHQVVCGNCSDSFMGGGKATCPCCRAPVQQRIRVFGVSS
ncbi:unnamed protein product [Eruca vesicaria subsp. sativa]|uniref:RING-type domain-containing protein n=1 Tax=Eruca vesicaria subsp. sativa TaxID=29727 RepID=A0ABC8KLK5_ERUVS|nr:unnamed protein product [Eruca vesicaria subsp. sativa]